MWRGGEEMSPISTLEDPHEHSHRGRKNLNQANLFRRSTSPKLYSHAVTFCILSVCLVKWSTYIRPSGFVQPAQGVHYYSSWKWNLELSKEFLLDCSVDWMLSTQLYGVVAGKKHQVFPRLITKRLLYIKCLYSPRSLKLFKFQFDAYKYSRHTRFPISQSLLFKINSFQFERMAPY